METTFNKSTFEEKNLKMSIICTIQSMQQQLYKTYVPFNNLKNMDYIKLKEIRNELIKEYNNNLTN